MKRLAVEEFRLLTSQSAISSSQGPESSGISLLQHDAALRDVYKKLLPLLQPPADPPRRRIGFHSE